VSAQGLFQTTISTGSLHYQDAHGAWQPIDDALVPDPTPGFAFTNTANRYQLHLPAHLGAGPVQLTVSGQTVSFAPLAVTGATPAAAAGATASYANVWPGVSVRYAALPDGVQEALILASAAAPHSFTFQLRLSAGLTAAAVPDGSITITDRQGAVVFTLPAPAMTDTSHRPAGRSRAVRLSLDPGGTVLTLTADAAWLADPARVYPVTIDPTVSLLPPTQDCYLVGGTYAATSFCGLPFLEAGWDGSEALHSLLQFNVAAALPAQSTILHADLALYLTGEANGTVSQLAASGLSHSWTPAATWNTTDGVQPWTTPGGDFTATDASRPVSLGGTLNTWVTLSPTQLVADWLSGSQPNLGLLVKEPVENGRNSFAFASAEAASNPPTLTVTYAPWQGARAVAPSLAFGLDDRLGVQVNLASGNLLVQASDLAIAGTGLPLRLERSFNSLSAAVTTPEGNGWLLDTGRDVGLVAFGDGSVAFLGPSGYQAPFLQQADGSFLAPSGLDATLVRQQDGSYQLTWHATGERYYFSSNGYFLYDIDQHGNTIWFSYNAATTTLAAATDTQQRAVSFVYNPSNLLTSLSDRTHRQVGYSPDGQNFLRTVTDAGGQPTGYGYNSALDLTTITDPLGQMTSLGYDPSHRLTSITRAVGTPVVALWGISYHSGSTVVTDPNQHQTTYSYDAFGRQTQVTDALGNTQQWSWTADSHVAQYTDGKQQPFLNGYDANNNRTSLQYPSSSPNLPGPQVRWGYTDPAHPYSPTSVTDAQGNVVTIHYTPNGDPDLFTNQLPSQNQTQVFYNSNGTVDHVLDARGNTTAYRYDPAGNLTQIIPPLPLQPTVIVPDALSRTSSVTDGKGQQRTYSYDNLDRLTALSYPTDAAGNVSSVPDADGNGRSMTDSTGTTSYQYDARNRQTQKALPAGGGTFGYGYDPVNNLTALTDGATVPGSPLAVSYGYNAGDQLTSLTESGKQTIFRSDQNNHRTSTSYPDGVTMTQRYDNSERLTSIVGTNAVQTVLSSFSYTYTKPGGGDTLLPYSYQETLRSPAGTAANVNGTMTYDPLNRLGKWLVTKQSDGSVVHDYVYQYDGTSNRTQIVADPQNSAGTIVSDPSQGVPHSNENDLSSTAAGTLNQIIAYGAAGTNPSTTTYSYDAAGNQTGNDGAGLGKPLSISYLPTNQTQSISNTSQEPVTMTWTGPGQSDRVRRTWTDLGTHYTTGFTSTPLGLAGRTTNAPNTPASSYFIRDPYGTPVAERNSDGTEYYYLFDGQGNVVGLEDPGTVVAGYDYCPTGNEADLAGGRCSPSKR